MRNSNDNIKSFGCSSLFNAIHWLKVPKRLITQAHSKYGNTFYIPLPGVGKLLLTGDPTLIKGIINNRVFIGGRGIQALRPILGKDSLIVTEGQQHYQQRSLLLPYFKSPYINQFDDITLTISNSVFSRLNLNQTHCMIDVFREITLQIILRIIFGDISQTQLSTAQHLVTLFVTSFNHPSVLYLRKLQINIGKNSPWGRFCHNKKQLSLFIQQQIDQCRNQPNNSISVLSNLVVKLDNAEVENIEPVTKRLSDEAIISEIISLLLFGSDTSAATMAWFIVDLGKNRDIKEKIHSELDSITSSFIANVPYLDAAIKESMRLNPVVVHLSRICTHATKVNGQDFSNNTHAAPCMYLSHYNENIYNNPNQFDPGHFFNKKPPNFSYYPFGLGDRRCLGEQLALRQMTLIMSVFLKHYDFQLLHKDDITASRHLIILVPSGGPKVNIMPRENLNEK